MPHYFFHVHDDIVSTDADGVELADDTEARECALQGARDLMASQVKAGYLKLNHWIRVTDEEGAEVLRVTFREAVTISDH